MTKKITLVVSLMAIPEKFWIAMRLITMLLLFGTIQSFAATGMFDDGNVSASDLQQKRVTGRISDAGGNPLAGVNILEKGTINGAISDANGIFTLTVASSASILSCSFIGYTTQEITVGDQASINIVLAEAVSALDEIVVVGYSTQTRKSLTGSVSTVNAAALSESASTDPMQRLQGKIAGVTILNQHTPGEGATIRIRGMTTINDSNPLYVVDGVPGGNYAPNDVESITILKDAAAQSIYGDRAANGVVLITTKGGKRNQKVSLNVNIRQGITRNSNFYDLLNTREWGEMLWLETYNAWKVAHDAWAAAGTGTEPVLTYNNSQYGTGTTPVIPDYIVPARTDEGSPLTDPALYDNLMAVRDGDDTYLNYKNK